MSESKKNLRQYPSNQQEKKDLIYNYYPIKISEIYDQVYIFSKAGQKEVYRIAHLNKKLKLNT